METKHIRGRLNDDTPNPIDCHVGKRMKLRRRLLNISQQVLAKRLGITFQQIQKYEKGQNRIGASRLWDIARALDVDMNFFFNDMPIEVSNLSPSALQTGSTFLPTTTDNPLESSEYIELARNYFFIKKHFPKVSKNLFDTFRNLSRSQNPPSSQKNK